METSGSVSIPEVIGTPCGGAGRGCDEQLEAEVAEDIAYVIEDEEGQDDGSSLSTEEEEEESGEEEDEEGEEEDEAEIAAWMRQVVEHDEPDSPLTDLIAVFGCSVFSVWDKQYGSVLTAAIVGERKEAALRSASLAPVSCLVRISAFFGTAMAAAIVSDYSWALEVAEIVATRMREEGEENAIGVGLQCGTSCMSLAARYGNVDALRLLQRFAAISSWASADYLGRNVLHYLIMEQDPCEEAMEIVLSSVPLEEFTRREPDEGMGQLGGSASRMTPLELAFRLRRSYATSRYLNYTPRQYILEALGHAAESSPCAVFCHVCHKAGVPQEEDAIVAAVRGIMVAQRGELLTALVSEFGREAICTVRVREELANAPDRVRAYLLRHHPRLSTD